jgi:hypothetical protein
MSVSKPVKSYVHLINVSKLPFYYNKLWVGCIGLFLPIILEKRRFRFSSFVREKPYCYKIFKDVGSFKDSSIILLRKQNFSYKFLKMDSYISKK